MLNVNAARIHSLRAIKGECFKCQHLDEKERKCSEWKGRFALTSE